MQAAPHNKNIATIQALRFVAALMVVFTHATFFMRTRAGSGVDVWNSGAQGVEIFFVISGFVMAWTARPLHGKEGAARYFLASRLIRIVPLYWLLNALKVVQVAVAPEAALVKPDWANIVLSMLFIPTRNSDGAMETFYGVGWTLNFEMFFYVIFATCLLSRVRAVFGVTAVMLVAAGIGAVRPNTWPAITLLFDPIVLNFVWGLVIAELYAARWLLHRYLAVAVLIASFAFVFSCPSPTMKFGGVQYALIVWALVSMEDVLAPLLPKWLTFGGDASYSLYLVHPMVGVVVAAVLGKLHLVSIGVGLAAIAASSLLVAACTYVGFERPVMRILRTRAHLKPRAEDALSAGSRVDAQARAG